MTAEEILLDNLKTFTPEVKSAVEIVLHKLSAANEKIFELKKRLPENLPGEIWCDIEGYNGYQVSNKGRVKSFKNGRILILKLWKVPQGYMRVGLRNNLGGSHRFVHILVAKAFIPNPKNLPEVDHINGIKTDNRVENLRWVTRSQNAIYAIEKGFQKVGVNDSKSKIKSEEDIRFIRKNYKQRDSEFGCKALAKKFNVSPGVIQSIVHNRSYKSVKD